ncbi:MAG TPA: flagellar motor protein MotD [Steroidobacteraceae bacterium]|nr:flagellar motor protein MotD [Steroidobacteraceae bacterium]HRX88181.1 flagellar motor protein MotD [Steroidobacteraceae bacterium]
MARRRRKQHAEHENHEAWAIPYGDLVTLLLAFFVVMYAISSVNESKYRVVSDSLSAAFRGTPTTTEAIDLKAAPKTNHSTDPDGANSPSSTIALPLGSQQPTGLRNPGRDVDSDNGDLDAARLALARAREAELTKVAEAVSDSMRDLINTGIVAVKRNDQYVEVAIRTDILFASGSAELSSRAIEPLQALAATLAPLPNPVRVEGHTDDRPISTIAFPSNWELSAARAASVVRLLRATGVNASRLAVVGLGEFRPLQANTTADGRNANRRVAFVIPATTIATGNDPRQLEATSAEAAETAGGNSIAMTGDPARNTPIR